MVKLICEHCSTKFNCGAPAGKDRCWCLDLPNLRGGFDLAGVCVCPDCLTTGKAKAMIKSRKVKQRQRAASALRKSRGLFYLFLIATKDGKPPPTMTMS